MTIDWISFALGGLVGVWVGAMAGIIIAALCHAAADADREVMCRDEKIQRKS